jgi:hypothetical protein
MASAAPLGVSRGAGQPGINDKAVPVFHQYMSDEAELRSWPGPLRWSRASGSVAASLAPRANVVSARSAKAVVGAPLAVKVAAVVAHATARRRLGIPGVLRSEVLHAAHAPIQSAVDAEMLVRKEIRRTLIRTWAPIFSSLTRMVPQVAVANWVWRRPIRHSASSRT